MYGPRALMVLVLAGSSCGQNPPHARTLLVTSPHVIELNQGRGLELEEGRVDQAVQEQLRALGHRITEIPQTSGLNIIQIGSDGLSGGADPRREGIPAGD